MAQMTEYRGGNKSQKMVLLTHPSGAPCTVTYECSIRLLERGWKIGYTKPIERKEVKK